MQVFSTTEWKNIFVWCHWDFCLLSRDLWWKLYCLFLLVTHFWHWQIHSVFSLGVTESLAILSAAFFTHITVIAVSLISFYTMKQELFWVILPLNISIQIYSLIMKINFSCGISCRPCNYNCSADSTETFLFLFQERLHKGNSRSRWAGMFQPNHCFS